MNPLDWKVRQGFFKSQPSQSFPAILGWDVSGVVTACAEDVAEFKVGDAVFAHSDRLRDGAYAESMAIRAGACARAPRTLSLSAAAAVPIAALTASAVLLDVAALAPGQRVLVHAGAGGVGSFAVQLAKRAGAYVISTASGDGVPLVEALGADVVVDHRLRDFADVAQDMDVVFDTVGGETTTRSFPCLKKGGLLVSIAGVPDKAMAAAAGVRAEFAAVRPDGARLEEIARIIDEGALKLLELTRFPLADAAAAQIQSASGRTRGKIILMVGTAEADE